MMTGGRNRPAGNYSARMGCIGTDSAGRRLVARRNLRCNAPMRHLLLLSLTLAASAAVGAQTSSAPQGRQTPAPTATSRPAQPTSGAAPAQAKPATPAAPAAAKPAQSGQAAPPTPAAAAPGQGAAPAAPAAPRRTTPAAPTAATGRGNLTIFVTDTAGAPLRDVRIQAFGPTDRSGTTDSGGSLRLNGVQVATYRLRFNGEGLVEFEREVTLRAGQTTEVDVTLRAAPPVVAAAPPPAPAPAAAPAALAEPKGPLGQPLVASIVDLVDKAFLTGSRKEALLSCSTNTRTTLVQLSDDQPMRLYDKAEVTYYVLGGEGNVKLGAREIAIKQDSFVSVPRGTAHSIEHKGRRPLIIVAQLSGEPCEQGK